MIEEKIEELIKICSHFFLIKDKLYILPYNKEKIESFIIVYLGTDLIYESKNINSILIRFKFNKELIELPRKKDIILQYLLKDINDLR